MSAAEERGLTLLEVMVALVVLSVVVAGYLQVLQGGNRVVARSADWSRAIGWAADGMEEAKLALPDRERTPVELLPDGFQRQVEVRRWDSALVLVTVTVVGPDGNRFDLRRLAPRPPEPIGPSAAGRGRGGRR